MAKNLRNKLPMTDTLVVFDVNAAASTKFRAESGGSDIVVAGTAREVAENAVSTVCG